MPNGRLSAYLTTPWMDELAAGPIYLALVSADPLAVSDPLSVEVVGGTYARQSSNWNRTGPNAITLGTGVSWTGLPNGAVVAGVAGFDAAFNGNLLFADLLDTSVSFSSGGTYTLPTGEMVVGIDVPTG